MFKSVVDFDGILLHFFSVCRVPWRFFASTRDRGGPNSCLFLTSYTVNNFNCVLICRASSWHGLGSFRRHLLRSACLRSCLRLFGWWSFWPHWIVRLHPSDFSLNSTGHHLLCCNRHKKRFCARQQPRVGLLYNFPRIRVGTCLLSFRPFLFLFPFSTRCCPLMTMGVPLHSSRTW